MVWMAACLLPRARAVVRGLVGCGLGVVLLAAGAQTPAASAALPPAPQRIVSLLPSATEAVCALGACDRLVGVDDFSLDPPQVQALPRLGRTWEPSIEAVVQLRPDLVLTGRTPPVQQRLQALGLKVLEADARTVDDIYSALHRIDIALQLNNAEKTIDNLRQELQKIQTQAIAQRQGGPAPRVYIEVDNAMYAAGPDSFMGQLLAQLGADNIVPPSATGFPQLTPEYVVRANPDLIIQSHAASLQALAQRPGWGQLKALRQGQVCQLNAQDSRVVTRPGPHLDKAAAILAQCLSRVATPGKASEKPHETQ